MHSSTKIRVAVLYGGRSSEHEVSLRSAANVIHYLDKERFEVVPIGIDQQGEWFLGDSIDPSASEAPVLCVSQAAERRLFSPADVGRAVGALSQLNNTERLFDVVFPAIHGPLCEDGTIQGLLELADIPYVGCGVLASSIGMDKDISKRLVSQAGLQVPPFVSFSRGQWQKNAEAICQQVADLITYPVFVKPSNTGSSIGVHKVKQASGLVAAIEDAFLYDTKVLVEQGIDALELEISVLESKEYGADPIVSVVGEIKPQNAHEFYSYAAKYLDDQGAALVIPASISQELTVHVQQVAGAIFTALDCEGMARVDVLVERHTNVIYFNEVNSLPGFTQISMYPKLMAASGMDYQSLLTHLIELALARSERKAALQRHYVAEKKPEVSVTA